MLFKLTVELLPFWLGVSVTVNQLVVGRRGASRTEGIHEWMEKCFYGLNFICA